VWANGETAISDTLPEETAEANFMPLEGTACWPGMVFSWKTSAPNPTPDGGDTRSITSQVAAAFIAAALLNPSTMCGPKAMEAPA
jgi:hypothetical protein